MNNEKFPHLTNGEVIPNNRVEFEDSVREQILRNPGNFAVIAIDLDGLKDINDSKGHAGGNLLLETADSVLRSSIRLGRDDDLGSFVAEGITDHPHGDEFWALLIGVDSQEEVDAVAGRLKERLATTAIPDLDLSGIQASMGGLVYTSEGMPEEPEPGYEEEELTDEKKEWLDGEVARLLKAADARMYDDKMQRTYDQFDQLSPEDKAEVRQDLEMIDDRLERLRRRLGGAAVTEASMSLRWLDKFRRALEWHDAKEAAKRAAEQVQDLAPSESPEE